MGNLDGNGKRCTGVAEVAGETGNLGSTWERTHGFVLGVVMGWAEAQGLQKRVFSGGSFGDNIEIWDGRGSSLLFFFSCSFVCLFCLTGLFFFCCYFHFGGGGR